MPEIGAGHKLTHQDGGADEISVAELVGRQIVVPYNGKIADITHADTDFHFLALATALSETRQIISINIYLLRISGTGAFVFTPDEGTVSLSRGSDSYNAGIVIAAGTQRLKYKLSVSNDDWDFYCFGYVVET